MRRDCSEHLAFCSVKVTHVVFLFYFFSCTWLEHRPCFFFLFFNPFPPAATHFPQCCVFDLVSEDCVKAAATAAASFSLPAKCCDSHLEVNSVKSLQTTPGVRSAWASKLFDSPPPFVSLLPHALFFVPSLRRFPSSLSSHLILSICTSFLLPLPPSLYLPPFFSLTRSSSASPLLFLSLVS